MEEQARTETIDYGKFRCTALSPNTAWWMLFLLGNLALWLIFGPNLWVLGGLSALIAGLMQRRIIKMEISELALYHVGFLVNGIHHGINVLYWYGREVPIESRKYLPEFPYHFFNGIAFGSVVASVLVFICFRLRWWISVPLMLLSLMIDFSIALGFWAD